MAWYEAHQTMAKHPKTLKLARLLKVDRRYAVGLLHDLFSWALDIAGKHGELPGMTEEDIAAALDMPGKKGLAAVSALADCGYLDFDGEQYAIHDWYDYAGRLSERREEEKAYAKRRYNLYNDMRLIKQVRARDGDFCRYCGKLVNWKDRKGADGGTYDHVDPDGENLLDNVVVACRSCNSKKRDRTPEQANMLLIPVGFTADNTVDSDRFTADNGQIKSAITVPNRTVPKASTITAAGYNVHGKVEDLNRAPAREAAAAAGDEKLGRVLSDYADRVIAGTPPGIVIEGLTRYCGLFDEDVIHHAFDVAIANNGRRWAYIDGILRDYERNGVRNMLDVQADDERHRQRKYDRKNGQERPEPPTPQQTAEADEKALQQMARLREKMKREADDQ